MRKQQNQAHTLPKKSPSSPKKSPSSQDSTLLVLFNKPYEVLCQFSAEGDKRTLAEFIKIPSVYAAGRLDFDSEGLLILTNNGKLQQAISHPRFKLPKTYWVQVEGDITDEALHQLRAGVSLNDGMTLPAQANRIEAPSVWDRHPPIRVRKAIPTSWVELVIKEGRNRQVRRMTAAVGFPTLRLIRAQIGDWHVTGMQPGDITLLGLESLPGTLRSLIESDDTNTHLRKDSRKNASAPSANGRDNRSRAHPPTRQRRPSAPSSRKAPRS